MTTELFRRQRKFAGERLTSINEGERFVLIDLAVVLEGDTEIAPGSTVDKVELIVMFDTSGSDPVPYLYSTLSGPIRDIAYQNVRDKNGKSKVADLPAIVSWHKVETKKSKEAKERGGSGFNDATVLQFHEKYTGKMADTVPPWSFDPITTDSNPL